MPRPKTTKGLKFPSGDEVPDGVGAHGDRGVAVTLGFVEPSSRVQIPSIAQNPENRLAEEAVFW
jgi:hypothetical protein